MSVDDDRIRIIDAEFCQDGVSHLAGAGQLEVGVGHLLMGRLVLDKVTLCALPDAIYQAYRRVLPRRKKDQPVEIDLSEEEQAEALADAAQYSYKDKEGGEA